jgi:signal transduction histidine kinase
LNVILSAGQLLDYKLKSLAAPDVYTQVNKHTYLIKQNCYRLIRLVSNLLDITKIDAGYFEINPRNCDIVKLVEDVTLSVAEYVESKNIELIFDTEVEEKSIACDADKIERVILNLLSNSAKFTPEGGSIFVNISIAEDRVIISVKDTGIGITKEIQSRIFDRFVQADDLLKKNNGGSGIGLSLVKAIIELHKGQILLKSEPGFGSEFIIELPDVTISDQCERREPISLENDKRIESAHIEFSDIYL